ncbi:MAG: hypothetical protein IPO67_18325 [Deltaproteobacteria bacterium]|nr:hypothetical protein [Deltaproteobacteria bacterium]MBK9647084.1 hypothetical protein [Deltaproteobacteria bacterium]
MLFASITEFGAVIAGYRRVLDDLARRQERLTGLLEPERALAGTLGPTDLVEILLFDSFFPMAEVGGSAAHAFRRAIGVFCPQPDDEVLRCAPRGQPQLASSILELACVQDVLAEDPERPFLGIIYAKASALAKLCVPALGEPGGDLLATALLRHFLNPAQRCWREDPLVYLTGALGDRTLPADLVAARLCVLGGLDSVDMVILVRAPRLELIGAVAWALRRSTLGDLWPQASMDGLRGHARRIAGVNDTSAWDHSPLFANTSTTLGVPMRRRDEGAPRHHLVGRYAPEEPGPYWTWESPRGDLRSAADEMALLVRYRFQPGTLRSLGEETGLEAQEEGKTGDALLQLFGQRDALAYNPRILQEPGQLRPVGRYTVDEILGFMSGLTGANNPTAPTGISSVTEVALVVHNMGSLRHHMPSNDLAERFKGRLGAVREFHLRRKPGDFPGPWLGTWLQGAKVAGLPYPLTNGVLNLVCSVLDYLDDDLESFLDLLPPLQHLIDWADAYRRQAGVDRWPDRELDDRELSAWSREIWQHLRDQPLPPQLRSASTIARFHETLEQLATFRGRRDHPMRAPTGTLAFEGHAGYRVSRDAFSTYVKALAQAFQPGRAADTLGRVIILDSAAGRPTCTAESGGTATVRVSAMAVHHPIHWVFGHEIAHASFSHTVVNSRPDLFRAGHSLCDAAKQPRNLLKGSIARLLNAVSDSLWDEFAADEGSPFCRAVADVLTEVAADLLEWRTLMLEGDGPDDAARRFWFVTGPGLVHGLRDIYGRAPIGLRRVARLLLRVYFVSRFTTRRMAPGVWREDLQDLCEWMFGMRDAMSEQNRINPLQRMADQDLIERMRCLKEDLEIPDEQWHAAVVNLVVDRSITAREDDDDFAEFSRVQQVVDAWIPFVEALMNLAPPPALDDTRAIYARYLDSLMAQPGWEHSAPWPQLIPGHPDRRAFERGEGLEGPSRRRPHYESPALSSRGGVMLASAKERQAYHDLTLRCILHLEDLSRARRREVLGRYLEQGERGLKVNTPRE